MNLLKIAALLLLCSRSLCPAETDAKPPVTTAAAEFKLKPGLYRGGEPGLDELAAYMKKADLRINLAGHSGISIGDESKLTLERARALADAVKEKRLVVIMEEKNFTDDSVKMQVQQMLKDAGFQELLIVGAHSAGLEMRSHLIPAKEQAAAGPKKLYVGGAADPEKWPYRYTLVRDAMGWSGEIEYGSIFFDRMTVVKDDANAEKIRFFSLYGGPGKALPVSWELVLTKSPTGYDGVLTATGAVDGIEPVQLKLLEKADAVMPSSEVEGKVLAMDDAVYRSEEALQHEVALAKRLWEKEAAIATRIAELRNDDAMRGGIRREWTGPAWVKERLKPEESKYFERICCVYLGGTAVTDEDLRAICGLTELRELFLHGTTISDAGLEGVDRLQGLRVLHLKNTMISGESVEKLKTLANLKELYLEETGITEEDCHRLQAALPEAKVTW